MPDQPCEEVAYEAPSAQERQAMDRGQTVSPLSEQARQQIREAQERRENYESRVEERREQTRRETALHLAVTWTANADEVPLGAVFGIADLMVQYVETGKKPTETEFARAVKPFRR